MLLESRDTEVSSWIARFHDNEKQKGTWVLEGCRSFNLCLEAPRSCSLRPGYVRREMGFKIAEGDLEVHKAGIQCRSKKRNPRTGTGEEKIGNTTTTDGE